jgi:hypothetical protein
VWQWRDVTALALLAQQFVDERFVDAEQLGDSPLSADSTLDRINYSFSEV